MKRLLALATLGIALLTVGSVAPLQAREMVTPSKTTQAALSLQSALALLEAGNQRFVDGQSLRRDYRVQVHGTASGQCPFATVLGCIDSRAAPEVVLDQGISDIFAPRIAGNFVNDDILGSMELASKVAGSRPIVVLGHTECSAINGACDRAELGNLTQTLAKVQPAVDAVPDDGTPRNARHATFVKKVTDTNVQLTTEEIKRRSPVLRDMADRGEIPIVGAMDDIGTGKVHFFD